MREQERNAEAIAASTKCSSSTLWSGTGLFAREFSGKLCCKKTLLGTRRKFRRHPEGNRSCKPPQDCGFSTFDAPQCRSGPGKLGWAKKSALRIERRCVRGKTTMSPRKIPPRYLLERNSRQQSFRQAAIGPPEFGGPSLPHPQKRTTSLLADSRDKLGDRRLLNTTAARIWSQVARFARDV